MPPESALTEQPHTEVVPSSPESATPATFDLGQPVADLHEGHEPVTWAGASIELAQATEHRPTSALDRDPARRKLIGAVGVSLGLALITVLIMSRDRAEPQAEVDPPAVETNIVFLDLARTGLDTGLVSSRLRQAGVRIMIEGPTRMRAVTHLDVSRADVERAADALAQAVEAGPG